LLHRMPTAIGSFIGLLQQQSYMLALRDVFYVSIACSLIAIFFTLFIRGRRAPARTAAPAAEANPAANREEEQAREAMAMEAMLVG